MFFRSKRMPLLFLALALIIILSACGGSSTLPASYTPTPTSQNSKLVNQLTQTLSAYCNALKNGDSQTIFSLSVHLTPELLYQVRQETFFKNAHTNAIASCKVEFVILSKDGNTASGLIVYTMGNGQVLRIDQPLVKVNGIWKVVGDVATLALQLFNQNKYAGYAITGSQTQPITYTIVTATWTVPTVSCSLLTLENSQSGTWAGLGDNVTDLEQVGTQSNCLDGIPAYYATWEVIQSGNQPGTQLMCISCVTGGDKVKVEVQWLSLGEYRIDFWNLSRNSNHWWKKVSGDATTNATVLAECIQEDPPDTKNNISPLSNFHKITITCMANNQPIGSAGDITKEFLMSQPYQKAKTDSLDASGFGKAFTITWVHA